MRKKKFILITLLAITLGVVAIFMCDKVIRQSCEGKLYTSTETIPFNRTGILLGTSKHLSGGNENPYYRYRITAAAELLKSGKIKYLVISGDNSRKNYNEPQQMKEDLIQSGIDSTVIFLDYAGFRTFDSMVRLREIFGQKSVTVISQAFHNERAIYIGTNEGITAIGYNAKDVGKSFGLRVQLREKLARVKVFVDYLFGTEPHFLGPKIEIPA